MTTPVRELAMRHADAQTTAGVLARALLKGDPTDRIARWRVWCEHCDWVWGSCADRDDAVRTGRSHVAAVHADDAEWSFRVQGIRLNEKAAI